MNAEKAPLGEQLGSVALRYQGWPPSGAGLPGRWAIEGRVLEAEGEPERAAGEPAASHRGGALAAVEAVLFLAREPVASRKLAVLADLADGTEARTLVRSLNRLYDAEGCAFRVAEVAGGFQLMTRAKFAPWLRRLHASHSEVRLSAPAMETLAVVAYRQPVLRAEIEAIRGVQCGEILRQLMERDLVRIVGRSEDLGRPFLYGTTRRFLQVFGLRHLDELPQPHQEMLNQLVCSNKTEGESNVSITNNGTVVFEGDEAGLAAATLERELDGAAGGRARGKLMAAAEDEDEEFEDEDEEFDDEEFDDEEFDDEDEEDEAEDDEDLEEDEWEEVEDEDEDVEEDELDEDEEEDEDWDDEDWDDEEDEDWEEEEEEEEEGEEDWE